MTHSVTPDPLPHRSGRRLLPVLAAFLWAVALHVAVAAGLAGYSGATHQVDSPPRGFKMVEVPGDAGAEEVPEPRESGGGSRKDDRSTASTEEAPTEPPNKPSVPEQHAEPEVIGSGGPLKKRLAETHPEPTSSSETTEASEEASQPGEDSGPDSTSGEEAVPEAPPEPAKPKAEASDENSGDGAEYRPPGVPAGYRDNPAPAYPARARRRHLEGKVVLKVAVDADGRPTEVSVASSSGHGILDRAAKETVTDWTFRPAKEDGRPVAGAVKVPIQFRLSQR